MMEIIDFRVTNALTISLLADIWTNKVIADHLAVAALILNKCFEREFMLIGMKPMSGDHTAQNVKVVLEVIINDYVFNKRLLVKARHFVPQKIKLNF